MKNNMKNMLLRRRIMLGLASSPFSPEATAILKENFPDYWNDIKAYGYGHPEMVPYINEDAYIICTLMDVGVTRWVTANGAVQVILNNVYGNKNTTFSGKFKQVTASSDDVAGVFGDRSSATKAITILLPTTGGANRTNRFGSASYTVSTKFALNTVYDIALNSTKLTVNDYSYNISSTNAFKTSGELRLFGSNGLTTTYFDGVAQLSKIVIGGDVELELHPFVRNNVNGFIDVLSDTFYIHQRSTVYTGHLSIEYEDLQHSNSSNN